MLLTILIIVVTCCAGDYGCHATAVKQSAVTEAAVSRCHLSKPEPTVNKKVANLARDYFVYIDVDYLTIITCWKRADVINLSKLLSQNGIGVSVLDINHLINLDEELLMESLASMTEHNRKELGVLLDYSCHGSDAVLEQSSILELFISSFKWLIVDSKLERDDEEFDMGNKENISIQCENKNTTLYSSLELKNLSIDTEIMIAMEKDVSMVYRLYDVYNVYTKLDGTLNIAEMGEWTENKGIIIWDENYKYDRRNTFQGITLRAVTVMTSTPNRPTVEVLRDPGYTPGVNGMTKLNSALLDLLQELFDFRVTYIITNVWGGINSDGSQAGMMGVLQRHEAEVSATGIRYTPERMAHAHFLLQTWEIQVSFFFRAPSSGVGVLRSEFCAPLSSGSWAACAGACALLAVVLTMTVATQRHLTHDESSEMSPDVKSQLSHQKSHQAQGMYPLNKGYTSPNKNHVSKAASPFIQGYKSPMKNYLKNATLPFNESYKSPIKSDLKNATLPFNKSYKSPNKSYLKSATLPFNESYKSPNKTHLKIATLPFGKSYASPNNDDKEQAELPYSKYYTTVRKSHGFFLTKNTQEFSHKGFTSPNKPNLSIVVKGFSSLKKRRRSFKKTRLSNLTLVTCRSDVSPDRSQSSLEKRHLTVLRDSPNIVAYAFFSVISAMCQQVFDAGPSSRKNISPNGKYIDGSLYPRSLSSRTAYLVLFLFSTLLYNYYTSSVVSSLLSAPPANLLSLQDLVDGPLELTFEDIGYTRSLFYNPNYSFKANIKALEKLMVTKKVLTSNRKRPIFLAPDEGIELVKKGGYAYHTEPETANPLIATTFDQDQLCDLQVLPMMEDPIFIALQKESPFTEIFRIGLIRLMERGHFRRASHLFRERPPRCSGLGRTLPVPLGSAGPALLLPPAACVLCFIILAMEIAFARYLRNKEKLDLHNGKIC